MTLNRDRRYMQAVLATALLVTLSCLSYGQTRPSPEVLAAGDPPLTRSMAETICMTIEWMLDLRFNAGQRDHITSLLVRDWKSGDKKEIEANLDWLRLAIAITDKSASERESFRRETAPQILQGLRAAGQSPDAVWLLAQYDEAQHANEQIRTIGPVSFVPPPGWQYAQQRGGDFAIISHKTAAECRISIFKAFRSSGDDEADFHFAWENLLRKSSGFTEPSFKMGHRSLAGYSGRVGCTNLVNSTGRPDNLCLTVLRAAAYTIPAVRFSKQSPVIDLLLDGVRLSPDRAQPQRKPLTVEELKGEWYHSSDSNQIYVYRTGGYAGSSTIIQGETLTITADGGFSSRYAGSWNGIIVREQTAGSVELTDGGLALCNKADNSVRSYRLISYQIAPDGTTVMTLMPDRYETNAANIGFYGEKWVRRGSTK